MTYVNNKMDELLKIIERHKANFDDPETQADFVGEIIGVMGSDGIAESINRAIQSREEFREKYPNTAIMPDKPVHLAGPKMPETIWAVLRKSPDDLSYLVCFTWGADGIAPVSDSDTGPYASFDAAVKLASTLNEREIAIDLLLEAKRELADLHREMGAPGDYGYGTREGDALLKIYQFEAKLYNALISCGMNTE